MKFIKRSYAGVKEILKTRDFEAIGVMVDGTGIATNSDGFKIVPAGTIVGGKTKPALANDGEVVVSKNTEDTGADAEGVLLHDVDVTHGDAPGSMVIRGNIDLAKIEKPVDEVQAALKGRILFIK